MSRQSTYPHEPAYSPDYCEPPPRLDPAAPTPDNARALSCIHLVEPEHSPGCNGPKPVPDRAEATPRIAERLPRFCPASSARVPESRERRPSAAPIATPP